MQNTRGTVFSQMSRWDVGTLSWVPWDGSLTTGSLTVGKVDQGAPGATPWLVSGGDSQGATYIGAKGLMPLGAVHASVPQYSDAQLEPLSMTVNSSLRTETQLSSDAGSGSTAGSGPVDCVLGGGNSLKVLGAWTLVTVTTAVPEAMTSISVDTQHTSGLSDAENNIRMFAASNGDQIVGFAALLNYVSGFTAAGAAAEFWIDTSAAMLRVTLSIRSPNGCTGKLHALQGNSFGPMPVAAHWGKYASMFDNSGGSNPIYYGIAPPGASTGSAVWQIRKFAYDGSGNLTSMLYADGTNAFTKTWTSRAGYTYS